MEKQPHQMSKDARRRQGLSSWCKDCRKQSARSWSTTNPEKSKENKRNFRNKIGYQIISRGYILNHRYGITLDKYDSLLNDQKGCCAICNVKQVDKSYHFHVDHCHTTKIVRGLLCSPCNVFLGVIKDDIEALKRAIVYLERNKDVRSKD